MLWWQFCEAAKCFPDTALALYSPRKLAERYRKWNPDDADPPNERDIMLMFQGETLEQARRV